MMIPIGGTSVSAAGFGDLWNRVALAADLRLSSAAIVGLRPGWRYE